jgi:hypothetical protein
MRDSGCTCAKPFGGLSIASPLSMVQSHWSSIASPESRSESLLLSRNRITLGLAIGGVVAWYASAVVRMFLFQTEPNVVRILAGALATLAAAGLLARAIPARRAASSTRWSPCDTNDQDAGHVPGRPDPGLETSD